MGDENGQIWVRLLRARKGPGAQGTRRARGGGKVWPCSERSIVLLADFGSNISRSSASSQRAEIGSFSSLVSAK